MTRIKTYEDIHQEVERHEGVCSFQMKDLRIAHGAKRLGKNVVNRISEKLAGFGLAHYPRTLPLDRFEEVRIYKRGTAVAAIIDAVITPGRDSDARLREATGGKAQEMLEFIREIVCDEDM